MLVGLDRLSGMGVWPTPDSPPRLDKFPVMNLLNQFVTSEFLIGGLCRTGWSIASITLKVFLRLNTPAAFSWLSVHADIYVWQYGKLLFSPWGQSLDTLQQRHVPLQTEGSHTRTNLSDSCWVLFGHWTIFMSPSPVENSLHFGLTIASWGAALRFGLTA